MKEAKQCEKIEVSYLSWRYIISLHLLCAFRFLYNNNQQVECFFQHWLLFYSFCFHSMLSEKKNDKLFFLSLSLFCGILLHSFWIKQQNCINVGTYPQCQKIWNGGWGKIFNKIHEINQNDGHFMNERKSVKKKVMWEKKQFHHFQLSALTPIGDCSENLIESFITFFVYSSLFSSGSTPSWLLLLLLLRQPFRREWECMS